MTGDAGMTGEQRAIFAVAARLHMSASAVERLSRREVVAWCRFFAPPEPEGDGVPDVHQLTRDEKRAMFRHARR